MWCTWNFFPHCLLCNERGTSDDASRLEFGAYKNSEQYLPCYSTVLHEIDRFRKLKQEIEKGVWVSSQNLIFCFVRCDNALIGQRTKGDSIPMNAVSESPYVVNANYMSDVIQVASTRTMWWAEVLIWNCRFHCTISNAEKVSSASH